MSLTESLTVEISGDSSQLESELERVGSVVDGLSSRLSSVAQQAGSAAGALSGFGAAVGAVNQLNAALSGVASQLRTIQQTRVSIDVSAALASLAQLSAAISRVAAQLASLNAMAGGGGGGGGPRPAGPRDGSGNNGGGPVRFATGGFVNGRNGVDRVPAYVTAGEFVVRPEIVERMGRPFFEQLNAGVRPAASAAGGNQTSLSSTRTNARTLVSMGGSKQSQSTQQHAWGDVFQDVSITVEQPLELDEVLLALNAANARQLQRFG